MKIVQYNWIILNIQLVVLNKKESGGGKFYDGSMAVQNYKLRMPIVSGYGLFLFFKYMDCAF